MASLTHATNMRELVSYLETNPLVRATGGVNDGRVLSFTGRHRGGLWFARTGRRPGDPDDDRVYLPIDCGLTAAETGLAFRPDGFDVTKFGVTFRYDYVPPPPADTGKAVPPRGAAAPRGGVAAVIGSLRDKVEPAGGRPDLPGKTRPVVIENATVESVPGEPGASAPAGQALRGAAHAALRALTPGDAFYLAVVSEPGQKEVHVVSNLGRAGLRACLAELMAELDEEDARADRG